MSKSLREGTEIRHAAPLLLVVEGLNTISAALVREVSRSARWRVPSATGAADRPSA